MIYSIRDLRRFLRCETTPVWFRIFLIVVCTPVVLVLMSIRLLVLPCISTLCSRLCSAWLRKCCTFIGDFTDKDGEAWEVPCEDGKLEGFSDSEGRPVSKDVEWKRPAEILPEGFALFLDGIKPNDIEQGELGDCWLLGAFAAAAEFPSLIQRAFNTSEKNWRGKYKVTLFDPCEKKWVDIIIDDRIPCIKGSDPPKPIFCRPNGGELWVLLLEKAFAKMCGGYGKLAGGFPLWALHVLTGNQGYRLMRSNGKWTRLDLKSNPAEDDKRNCDFYVHRNEETHEIEDNMSDDLVFEQLIALDKQQAIMTCDTGFRGRRSGLVGCHAYSLIAAVTVPGFRLVKIRNPWGSGEWTGAWCDGSEEWHNHPKIAKKLKADLKENDDGVFWMEWNDFLEYFDGIGVLRRSVDLHDVVLNTHEGEEKVGCWVCPDKFLPPWMGPCVGCVDGCASYYCFCEGCIKFCCARQATSETATAGQSMLSPENKV
mmetsp:Transcript_30013/g.95912  ORF Transcript_30013/g.95912 Transcript_30013/m.95912 type:complete len:482 (-) Transcript_30013:149-1594(-)